MLSVINSAEVKKSIDAVWMEKIYFVHSVVRWVEFFGVFWGFVPLFVLILSCLILQVL